jgi:hypothetical protein
VRHARIATVGVRRLALPESIRQWSLTTLQEKLVKIGAKATRHSKYVTFQLAEVAVPRVFGILFDHTGFAASSCQRSVATLGSGALRTIKFPTR